MSFGITPQGFKRKRLADIKTERENRARALFGNFINLLPSSLFSQFIGIESEREDALWEALEDVYNSGTLSSEGVNLDNVVALTSVTRLSAQKSLQLAQHLFGDNGALIPAGTQIRIPGNTLATFTTLSTVLLGPGQDQSCRFRFQSVPDAGQYRFAAFGQATELLDFDATASEVEEALNALDVISENGSVTVTGNHDVLQYFDIAFSGNIGKIQALFLSVIDSTLETSSAEISLSFFQWNQVGIPQGTTDMECVNFGPTVASAMTLTEIVNPVSGLTGALNPTDANVGRDVESDNDLRARQKIAQAALGRSSVDALRARLLDLDQVQQAIVFENDGDIVDGNGLPPHSIRAYVQGGLDQDIWNTIWENKAAGIYTDGTEVGDVVDTQGITQVVRFSRPEIVPIYIDVTVDVDEDLFPSDGADQIKAALVEYVNSLEIGQSVIVYPRLISSMNGISGILDITLLIGDEPAPSSDDNIEIDIQEIARVVNPDTAVQVTVNT